MIRAIVLVMINLPLFAGAPSVAVIPFKRYVTIKLTITACFRITGFILNVTHREVTKMFRGDFQQFNITQLHPFSNYDIQAKAIPDGLWSDMKNFQTKIAGLFISLFIFFFYNS